MRLALRGLRDLDAGPEPITDRALLSRVRRQARRVHLKSLLATALLVTLYLLIS